ncbi:MAG TPA: SIS domain-containing protein, partial [Thermodesulfobacteriota bacterium]|nr:SIS domain-containing protein [Thermodesulfobacteriota bacterium]
MVTEYCTAYFKEIKKVLDGIDLKAMEKFVDLLLRAYRKDNRIFVMGNGGSASAASHFACDINKGACLP